MADTPRVFISATTRDLGSCRMAVRDVLLTLGVHPVLQDHFAPDYRTVADKLRGEIGKCHAVICLVGRVYGQEPSHRTPDQPRRSYTQLEYDIAIEEKKPVFVFVATDECPTDAPLDESQELLGLQLEHLKRIVASDRLRMPFRSREHLLDQVRVMRFDAESLAEGVTTRLVVLLTAELTDTAAVREQRGEAAWVREFVQPCHELLRQVVCRRGGTIQSPSPTEFQVNFETTDAAVNAALELHHALRGCGADRPLPGLRVGIHVGQVVRFGGAEGARVLQASHALAIGRHLCALALPHQTLLTRAAFDIAREHIRRAPFAADGSEPGPELRWQSHGRYAVPGAEESLEVFEAGVVGEAPLKAPPDGPAGRRADSHEERRMEGWRPALDQEIPRRSGWIIERKLGEGGFGEVWVARHDRTRRRRVFKFCFDATRLSSFKRELTLFRLLREALGDRDDIAQLLEVELDEAPFFLESEYVEGGNFHDWCAHDGRLTGLSLAERLRLVAETAEAVAAAHSVGVIHKDLKPSNIFMRQSPDGAWHPVLADFGIGAIADKSLLEKQGITVTGFTVSLLEPGSSRTGTRMYQPPEAHAGRPATVQADIYALGVLLYQVLIGDLDRPLGIGWEARLESARARGLFGSGTDPESAELIQRLIRDDLFDCVHDDPAQRLGSAAQLAERLRTLDSRMTALKARRRAERSAVRMRRLRAALAVSLAALLVVGGLAAFAALQWRRAHANARKAEANAEAARQQGRLALETLHAIIFDLQRGLKNLAAGSEVRRRLLTTALERLEKLSSEFVAQTARDRDTAAALIEMGDLILQFGDSPKSGTSGESAAVRPGEARGAVEAAWRLYSRSLEIVQALAQADPKDARAQRDLSKSYSRLGDVYRQLGSTDKALEHHRKAFGARESLAQADPKDAQAQRDLSLSYERLGDVYLQLGSTDKALQHYRKALGVHESLAQADPKDAQAQRDLSISYNKLGNVYLQLGSTDKALEHYRKALGARESLAQADPKDAQAQRDLSISYNNLGDVYRQLGSTDKALEHYRKALGVSESLAQADPKDAQAQRDLSISYNTLGDVYRQLGSTDKALEHYRKDLEISQSLAQADPKDARAQRDLSISYIRLGDVYRQLGSTDKALEHYRKALGVSESLAQADPKDAQAQRDLSYSYYAMGQACAQAKKLGEARTWYEKSLAVEEALSDLLPRDAGARRKVAGACELLGTLCGRLGDGPAAVDYARRALEHARAARALAGGDQPFRWDFSITLGNLADALSAAGQPKEARQRYEEAIEARPDSASCQHGLAWLLATSRDDAVRDGKRAVALATKARELSQGKLPTYLNTLAAAHAEAGQFAEAVKWQKEALAHPEAFPASEVEEMKERLKLYESGKPYHQPKPPPAPAAGPGP
jgi:tetratricopeptide (TPR) repeat protein/tRNA A-37 threonylcarbamoyl transferase component Bud32